MGENQECLKQTFELGDMKSGSSIVLVMSESLNTVHKEKMTYKCLKIVFEEI